MQCGAWKRWGSSNCQNNANYNPIKPSTYHFIGNDIGLRLVLLSLFVMMYFSCTKNTLLFQHPACNFNSQSLISRFVKPDEEIKQLISYGSSMRHWTNADLKLGQYHGQWNSIKLALVQCLVFAGCEGYIIIHSIKDGKFRKKSNQKQIG